MLNQLAVPRRSKASHQSLNATLVEASSKSGQGMKMPSRNTSRNGTVIEARLLTYCYIACDLVVTSGKDGMAVKHNDGFHIFEPDAFDEVLAWLKAVHFMSNTPFTQIQRSRIFKEAPAALELDVVHAHQSGITTLNEARQQIMDNKGTFQEGYMPCWLPYERILTELGQHYEYSILEEDREVCRARLVHCDFSAHLASCNIQIQKAWS